MRLVLLLASLLGLSLAASVNKQPKPCQSPPLMSGAISLATQNEEAFFYAPYEYDALLKRIRISEAITFQNQSFSYNVLLLYTEGVMYEINSTASSCVKRPLQTDFQPLAVPPGARLLGQAVWGSSSGPGEGVLVNTWAGRAPGTGVKYMSTVTEVQCVPVSLLYQTQDYGWVAISFINTIRGLVDPNALNTPSFCPGPEVQPEGPPADFFSLVLNMRKRAQENGLHSYMAPF